MPTMGILRKVALLLCLILLPIATLAAWNWVSVSKKQVEFRSGELLIRGTLLSPRWSDAAPGIVLVHGSGKSTRRSMLAYAWLFAIKGYAALAYDKRGVGESEGQPHEWREFNFVDLAADAASAYQFLQSAPKVDPARVGYLGVSQGGWVVSLAADQTAPPAFVIMASASLSTVAEDRIFGLEAQVRYSDFDADAVSEASELILADHQASRTRSDYDGFARTWDSYKNRAWFKEVYRDTAPEPIDSPYRQWEKTILDFDPLPLLEQVDTPILWIFGDPLHDRFSPVSLSVQRVSASHTAGACYQIIQIDDVGHTLEPVDNTGLFPLLKVRIPLVLDMYSWLDGLSSPQACDP